MNQDEKLEEARVRLVCVWCGIIVKSDGTEVRESNRMCKDCYYQMIGDYFRSCQGAGSSLYASER